ncbi:hypothetical protein FRB99_002272 [Tulasnella sp. 403]|nr:hypothetical protein FRB99_002272 [Tulasnella sp. 403]
MHTALKIPEILLLTFDALGFENLLNPSLVCSTWAPFALSITWEKKAIWLKNWIARLQPSISADDTDSRLSEYPLPTSWADLLRFSLKVQNIFMDADISCEEAERIKKLLQGRPFFPNARKVYMWFYTPHESVATLLLDGSTRINTFACDIPEEGDMQPVEKWVQLLHPNAVRQFQFFIPVPSAPFDLTRFHRLRDLEIYDDKGLLDALDFAWWRTFAGLQALRRLILETKAIIPPTTMPSTTTFPHLQSLELKIAETSTLMLLLHSTMPLLLELSVREPMLKGPEFCELMSHLKQHSPLLENLRVKIMVDVPFLMGNSIPTTLADFQLKGLDLTGHIHTTTIPNDRVTFVLQDQWAKMLEPLEEFVLWITFLVETETGEAITDEPVATEDTLVAILKTAKKLKRLSVEIVEFETHSFIGKLEKEYGRVPVLGLYALTLAIDNTSSDFKDIEKDLRSAFPGLKIVNIYPCYS